MATFYAQPYDIHASGFYFDDAETYHSKITSIVNDFGDPVEEFEIQFIDGEQIDCELAQALCPNQVNVLAIMEAIETWDEEQKTNVILAVGESGYSFDLAKDSPDDFDVFVYYVDSLTELAEQFVDEGLYSDLPAHLSRYIDYDAIAYDLGMDYSMTNVAGQSLAYYCA
ncbi:MAG: antirestriction protein ArdA [Sulfitobacter sp.]